MAQQSRPRLLYIASGRSFHTERLPRKIKQVVETFRRVADGVTVISGGDVWGAQIGDSRLAPSLSAAVRAPLLSPVYNSVSEWRDIANDLRLHRLIRQAVAGCHPQIIWERSSRLHGAGMRIAQSNHIPYVLEWKDNLLSLYGASLFKPLGRYVEKRKMANASFIVVESSKLADMLSKQCLVERDRFVVAINAVDSEEFSPGRFDHASERKRLGIQDDRFVVAYVGSYAWYHKTAYLVEAARLLKRQERMQRTLFLMVGDGPDRARCEVLVNEYGLHGFFRFLGRRPQSEIPSILSAVDAAVLPDCLDIVCPIKVQEYMSMALPVVVPRYEANEEVVTDDRSGVCFVPEDIDDLAQAILRLSRDEGKAKVMGQRARERVVEDFTWEKTWGEALQAIWRHLGAGDNWARL